MTSDRTIRSGEQISGALLREFADMRLEPPCPPETVFTPAMAREIARMGAMHVIDVVRDLEATSRGWTADERAAWSDRVVTLRNELSEADVFLRRLRVENNPPQFICTQAPPPVRPPRPSLEVVPLLIPRIRRVA